MTDGTQGQSPDMVALASDIVSAYVSNNNVRPVDLPDLIALVHQALHGIAGGTGTMRANAHAEAVEQPTASQIRKSITPEGLVSFIDGKTYKTLKRHLTANGLTPQAYRAKYGLPADYPMTSSNYSAQRSALAKSLGLGNPSRLAA